MPDDGPGSISVISGANDSVVAMIGVGSGPLTPMFDPVNGDIYVPISGYALSVISGANNTVFTTFNVCPEPQTPALDPVSDTIYLPCDGWVLAISGSSNSMIGYVLTGGSQPSPITP